MVTHPHPQQNVQVGDGDVWPWSNPGVKLHNDFLHRRAGGTTFHTRLPPLPNTINEVINNFPHSCSSPRQFQITYKCRSCYCGLSQPCDHIHISNISPSQQVSITPPRAWLYDRNKTQFYYNSLIVLLHYTLYKYGKICFTYNIAEEYSLDSGKNVS